MIDSPTISRAREAIKTTQNQLGFEVLEITESKRSPTSLERTQIEMLNFAQEQLANASSALHSIEIINDYLYREDGGENDTEKI